MLEYTHRKGDNVRAISEEKRGLLIAAKQRGEKEEDIAKWLEISKGSIGTIWRLYRKTGSFLAKPYTGRRSAITPEKRNEIEATISAEPDITLSELIEKLSLPIQKSQLSRLLISLDYSYKKTTYPAQQDRPAAQEKRKRFQEAIKFIKIENLVPLDESSINLAYTRLYGRAKTNERVKEGVVDARFERQSILSTIRLDGRMCPLTFEGTLNKETFVEYIKSCLKPTLSPEDVLLLDNSSVHTSKLVLDTLKECGIQYLFLPPYSPDFNPIELFWAFMKSILKKLKARTHEKLEDAINIALDSVELHFIANWFKHCGYIVNL